VSRNGKTYLKSSASALLKSTNRLDIDHSHSVHHPLLGPKVFMCWTHHESHSIQGHWVDGVPGINHH
jgi:hypothetical protein